MPLGINHRAGYLRRVLFFAVLWIISILQKQSLHSEDRTCSFLENTLQMHYALHFMGLFRIQNNNDNFFARTANWP